MKEDDPKYIIANLIFWGIIFGIVLSSFSLKGWAMLLFWFSLYAIGWVIKLKWGQDGTD